MVWITDIGKSFTDIGKSFTDIGKSFTDIGKSRYLPISVNHAIYWYKPQNGFIAYLRS